MLAVAVPSIAHAEDQVGPAGLVAKVEVNTPSADAYLQYHGRVFIKTDKVTNEYRWGGTSCGTRIIDAALLDALVDAASSGMNLMPSFQDGQAGAKCLVGFSFVSSRR
jgi:hypothetical protein